MKHRFIYDVFLVLAFFLSGLSSISYAQKSSDQWLRVLTQDDLSVDIRRLSLRLRPDDMIEAEFRWNWSNVDKISGTRGTSKSRIDTIQFDPVNKNYRVLKNFRIDPSGEDPKDPNKESTWKRLSGETAHKLYAAALQLPPFGLWRIISYRYITGEEPSNSDPAELKSLVGSYSKLGIGSFTIGKFDCNASLTHRHFTDSDWVRMTGSNLRSLGVMSTETDALYVSCEPRKEAAPLIPIVLTSNHTALMLWEGVFLEMERQPQRFSP